MNKHFLEPQFSEGKMKLELDLSNYTTKTDLKNETGNDTSKFVKKIDLESLKSHADKLDNDKQKMYQLI